MYQVSLDEARIGMSNLIDVAIKGEEVFIKDEQWMIQLVPTKEPKRYPQFGSAKGLVAMTDDFDAPLADFEEYIALDVDTINRIRLKGGK